MVWGRSLSTTAVCLLVAGGCYEAGAIAGGWRPIDLCCDLDDDWCDPFVGGPNGCSGAPRQGWLATPDGFLTKEFHLFYGLTSHSNGPTNIHTGMFQLQYPLSRRTWFGIDVPFSNVIDRPNALPDLENFDDVVVTGRVLMHETRNLGLTAELGVRTPTGDEAMGGGITALRPATSLWSDVGDGWSLRGGIGVDVGLEGVPENGSDTDLLYNVSLGQTVTPHDYTPLGDFTYYVATNGRSGLSGPETHTYLSVTPGMRTHLGDNLFFLMGLQLPVSGPTPFDSQAMFMLVKGL